MKNPQVKQNGRKPGKKGKKSVRFLVLLFFLSLLAGVLAPPFGFSAGKGKMVDRINWPGEVAGWKWDREAATFKGTSLYDYIDGTAEVYLAYNYRQVSARRYIKPDQPDMIWSVPTLPLERL